MSIDTKIKLDICIPTFQRSSECLRQTFFLLNEIKCIKDYHDCEINVYIRDNSSSKEDYTAIVDGIEKCRGEFFGVTINRNDENLGLIGNIRKMLLVDSSADYVWFVGDDDILFNGILDKVICSLSDKKIFYL
ncbi:glycosyltransferase family 2 protein [Aeromonas hydrophila]